MSCCLLQEGSAIMSTEDFSVWLCLEEQAAPELFILLKRDKCYENITKLLLEVLSLDTSATGSVTTTTTTTKQITISSIS